MSAVCDDAGFPGRISFASFFVRSKERGPPEATVERSDLQTQAANPQRSGCLPPAGGTGTGRGQFRLQRQATDFRSAAKVGKGAPGEPRRSKLRSLRLHGFRKSRENSVSLRRSSSPNQNAVLVWLSFWFSELCRLIQDFFYEIVLPF